MAEQFVGLLVEKVRSCTVGDPRAGAEVELGPLVSEAHFQRVKEFIDRAIADGAAAAFGGGPLDGDGFFIAATVLTGVKPGSEASQEEIFGPVVTVETCRSTP